MKPIHSQNSILGPSGCISNETFFKYLNNELSIADQHIFEKHISSCMLCSEALEGFEKNTDQIEKTQTEIDSIRDVIKNKFANTPEQVKKRGINRTFGTVLGVAASIIIVVVAYFIINIQTKDIHNEMAISKTETTEEYKPKNEELTKPESAAEGQQKNTDATILLEKQPALSLLTPSKNGENPPQETFTYKTTTISGEREEKKPENFGGLVDGDVSLGYTLPDKDKSDSVLKNELDTDIAADEIAINNIPASGKTAQTTIDGTVLTKETQNKKETKKKDNGVAAFSEQSITTAYRNNNLVNGIYYYNTANYKDAISQFQEILNLDKNNSEALYYMAMSLYYYGQKENALSYFDKLIKKKDKSYYDLALWQKALILSENNQKEQAIELLNQLVKKESSLKINAQQKIDELNKP